MSETLDAIRGKFPGYADRSDEDMTLAIGAKHPVYLQSDPAFEKEYNIAFAKRAQTAPENKSLMDRLSRFAPPSELQDTFNERTGQMASPAEGMAGAGKLIAGTIADTGLALGGSPTDENSRAAGLDPLARALPIEQQLTDLHTLGGSVTKGLLSVPKQAPALALGTVLAPVLSPFVSFPLAFGTQTYGETGGDKEATAKSAALAALFPLVGKLISPVVSTLGLVLVKSGLLKAGNITGQKAVEAAVHQAAFQTVAQAADLPEYLRMTPRQRLEHFAESTAALTMFALPQILNIPRGSVPSETQARLRQMALDAARQHYEKEGQPVTDEAPPKMTEADRERSAAKAAAEVERAGKAPAGPQLVVGKEPGPGEYRVTDESVIKAVESRQPPVSDPSAPIGQVPPNQIPDWAREEMSRRGIDPARQFNDVDLGNPSIVEAIKSDPTLTEDQKARLLQGSTTPPESNKVEPSAPELKGEAESVNKGALDFSPEGVAGRMKFRGQLHDLGPGSDPGRWDAIENTYIHARAAEEALPDVKPGDRFGVVIKKGPYPASPVVDHFWVARDQLQTFNNRPELKAKYPPGEFTTMLDPGSKPYSPRKGEPSYKDWLAGKRPASAFPPVPKPEPAPAAEEGRAPNLEDVSFSKAEEATIADEHVRFKEAEKMSPFVQAAFRAKRAKAAMRAAGKWAGLDARGRQRWRAARAEFQAAAAALGRERADLRGPEPKPAPVTPEAASGKVEDHVEDVARGDKKVKVNKGDQPATGQRPAKEIKAELIGRLQAAIEKAPNARDVGSTYQKSTDRWSEAIRSKFPRKTDFQVTIDIPGDGEFTTFNTKEHLGVVLERAKRLNTSPTQAPVNPYPKTRPTGNIPPDVWVESSEPTHKVSIRNVEMIKGKPVASLFTRPGKPVEVKGYEGRRLLLTSNGKVFSITEPHSGMGVGQGETIAKAIESAEAKPLDKLDAAIADAIKQYGEVPPPEPLRPAEPETLASPGEESLFAPPALERGGELGSEPPPPGAPPRPADNPNFSVFDALPMELPEAVRLSRDLLGGIYPKVRAALSGLRGRAAGVFIHTTGPEGRGRIEIRADAADLLTAREKADLLKQAEAYARAAAETPREYEQILKDKYEDLLAKAYEEAKSRNPLWALKVMWHEIGHLVDWLPDKYIIGRGNLFGHIAALKSRIERTLPIDPLRQSGEPPREADLRKLRAEAEKQLRDEMGPIREIISKIIVEEPILKIVGITTEDVKNLLGLDAREKMPELYRWFAEQPGSIKQDILRKAMRGLLDERLAAMGRTEQVGTQRTEKTVRSKVGREPTPQEIRDRFKTLFRAELEKRNLAQLDLLRGELRPMIAWWRGMKEMEPYFDSGHEMYAEAFSVLMNNPAAVLERAPNYYRLMFNYMQARPEVAQMYGRIQDQIKSGLVMGERVGELRSMWRRDDEASLRKFGQTLHVSGREWLDNVVYHFDRRLGPIYRAAGRGGFEGRVREALGNYLYRASEHELILNRLNIDVGKPLVRSNLDWSDLGEFMFHNRIVQDRFNIFNPQGWTSKNSLERLAEMERTLGPEAWQTLVKAQENFRAIYEKEVLSRVRAAGLFSDETQKLIDDRVWYATFAAVKGEPTKGIDQLIAASVGSDIGPRIYRQIGNLGEIKNPATATVLKALSLVSAAERNIARRETVRMLFANDPENIRRADRRFDGKRMVDVIRENAKMGTVVVMNGGKAEAYYVRKPVAEALNFGSPIENQLYSSIIGATNWLKGMFTQLNYAFWPVNFVRDTGSFWLNMPGVSAPVGWAKNFPKALVAAKDSVRGRQANPVADAALRRRMLISRADPRGVWAAQDNEFDLKVASFGLDPAQWDKQAKKVGLLTKGWQHYRNFGQIAERVNKIGGMLYLDERFPNMPEWKKQQIVRERAGSPNFLERGASNAAVDLFAMFYNPWKEGIRSMTTAARENPWSFGAKVSGLILAPSLLQSAATLGLLGDDLKRKYRSVPDYDLTNYLIIPLGWADKAQSKVVYFRLPLPEPARLAHGLLYKSVTGRGQDSMAYMGGQLPAVNAMLGVGAAWAQYELAGHNPYDAFRGKGVLDDTTFAAGGWPARWALAQWSWNNLGGPLLYRFQNTQLESPPEGPLEGFLQWAIVNNALGRWIKVSNRGLDDEDKQLTAPIQQHRAEIRLGMKDVMEKVASGQALTDSEKVMLREPYAVEYLLRALPEVMKARNLPLLRRMKSAGSKEGAAAVLRNAVEQGDLPAPR